MVRTLISLLPALGCAAAMFFCLRMASGHHGQKEVPNDASQAEELARLREEIAELRDQLAAARDEEVPTSLLRR